jgi:hypothetical protein
MYRIDDQEVRMGVFDSSRIPDGRFACAFE